MARPGFEYCMNSMKAAIASCVGVPEGWDDDLRLVANTGRTAGKVLWSGSGGLAHHPRGVMAWPRCRSTIGVEGVSVVRWRLAPLPIDGGPGARMADRTE